ncbi:PAS domain-containing sensor histidine kinase [Rhizobium sp. BK251]|uniref:PAS domain-containing sensor histidine kinase n=1 Tax=Rhizobium sp. BK251 TaxID=2512125 RepID=UPI0010E102E2|nr:PAS domain-containing sensor histidine kinase [Rhizobium sp. BK251]TCL74891.1 phospho-acceptor domain-containing protein [Rhizobium sp. BK251]
MTYWNVEFQLPQSRAIRYGFAAALVAVSTAVALAFRQYHLNDVALPVLVLAVGVITWYAGSGPAVLAVLLSSAIFNYLFAEPLYTFYVSAGDLPYFFVFICSAIMISSFSAVRRRIEENLRHARDRLQVELEHREQREAEIRKLNQELVLRATELEAANKELESFAYSVSHDLRAPLRHLVGYSELLQKHASSSLDTQGQRYLQTILESGKRMGNLIDDLLAFSRIGRVESRQAAVDLQQVVNEVAAEIGQTKGQEISWTIGALPPCHGDRSLLKLVFVNLLSNAVKFSGMRRPAKIEIGSVDLNGDQLEIFVRDNGVGFDMQYVNKLFGVFQRLHRADEFEGTGIGLATVQRIVHRHGGTVRAESKVDQGATFYFSLPKAKHFMERTVSVP